MAVSYLRSFLFPRTLKSGTKTSAVSLTAHDGTWVQTKDHLEESRILWVSCKNVNDETTQRWLRSFSRSIDDIESLNCRLFVVSSQTLDEIRTMHRSIDLSCLALYDPFAMESRKLGLSGRRPKCRDSVLLVSEQGIVMEGQCGQTEVGHWLTLLGAKKDVQESTDDSVTPIIPLSSQDSEILIEQGGVLVDVRTFSEYEPDHVPNSLHIPVDELPQRYKEIGQDSRIIFICQAGGRAFSAAEFMTSIGATDIYVVNGGMSSWTGTRETGGEIS